MPVLEKSIEGPCVTWAKARGIVVRKMNGFGTNHWPDRMFLYPGGRVVFIEFKTPGKRPTPMQSELHAQLRALGFECHVVDKKEDGIAILSAALEAGSVPAARGKALAGTRSRRPAAKAGNAKD